MPERVRVAVFCEDEGHEALARALITRLADQVGVSADVSIQSGRGGAGKVRHELRLWVKARAVSTTFAPDVVLVLVDADATGPAQRRRELRGVVPDDAAPSIIMAFPDPHVERWVLADARAFEEVTGAPPTAPGSDWKAALRDSLAAAGQLVLTTPMQDYAHDIVAEMDLYGAGKLCPELGKLIDALTAAFTGAASRSVETS